jgi:hypothetical protein
VDNNMEIGGFVEEIHHDGHRSKVNDPDAVHHHRKLDRWTLHPHFSPEISSFVSTASKNASF